MALVLAAAIAFLGTRVFNPYSGVAPHIDSGVYLGVAEHLLHGKVLYREVWDHKPPMVYLVDAVALVFGDHTVNSVRTLEVWLAVLALLALFVTVALAFDSVPLGALGALLFAIHFYHPSVMRGNQPEEYGSIEALLGTLLCIVACRTRGTASTVAAVGSGLALGLSCLTKEPFLFGVLPWFGLLLWKARSDRRTLRRLAGAFSLGFSAPILVFAAYLASNAAFSDWVDVVRFNLSYVHYDAQNQANPALPALLWHGFERGYKLVFGVSRVAAALAGIGAASALVGGFRRRTAALPVVLVAFFVLSVAAASMAREYGYYFLQVVPSYVLLVCCGLALLLDLTRGRRVMRAVTLGALVLLTGLADRGEASRFARAALEKRARFFGDSETVAFIRANSAKADRIWSVIRGGSAVYAHADRLSPTRFLYMSGFFFRDLPNPEGTKEEIRRALDSDPPKFVLCDGDESLLVRAGLDNWFHTNYDRTPLPVVFERKAAGPGR